MPAGWLLAVAASLGLARRCAAATPAAAGPSLSVAVDASGSLLQPAVEGALEAAATGSASGWRQARGQLIRRQDDSLGQQPDFMKKSTCPNDKGLAGYRFSHAGIWNAPAAFMGPLSGARCAWNCDMDKNCLGFSVVGAQPRCYTYKLLQNETATESPLDDFSMAKCDDKLPFDCTSGFDNWDKGWSVAKKQWCCTFKSRGCPQKEPPACVAPMANQALFAADYIDCLGQKCDDAEGQFIQAVTNASFQSCKRLLATFGGDCSADLSLLCDGDCAKTPPWKVPEGTKISDLCNKNCPATCHPQKFALVSLQRGS